MIFECNEGHRVYSTWKKMRNRLECPICKKNIYKEIDTKTIPKTKEKRVLAIDQATRISGYSIFDGQKLVSYGTFSTTRSSDVARYLEIKNWFINMLHNWKPDYVVIEGIQFQETSVKDGEKRTMGITVFETLARLQGILMLACYEENIQFEVVSTNTWRAHCNVKGRTRTDKKHSMQMIIKNKYDMSVSDDIADAIGIGIYGAAQVAKTLIMEDWE
jgi:Holliday junction resolvasome RuvABC endonuclease subunit